MKGIETASRELDIAVRAVRTAGRMLLKASPELRSIRHKEDHSAFVNSRKNFITEMDRRCETAIQGILCSEFPAYGVIGEEQAFQNTSSEKVWVIDPLDGTLSYAHGLDSYVTAVGLVYRQEAVLGVVFQPEKNELYVAEKGSGAFLNGTRICVSQEQALESSVISMDHRIFRIEDYPRATGELVRRIRRLRVSESCSQELCYVACGRLDGLIRTLQPTYDYMMGKIIVEEAGGVVKDFQGQRIAIQLDRERNTNFVAGNTQIVSHLIEYLGD
jgi:myo-inositol-1(or 4)-monophosphatase